MKEMVYSSDPNADREILDEGYVHGYRAFFIPQRG